MHGGMLCGRACPGSLEDSPMRDGDAARKYKDSFCNIMYTFQKGNCLAELARTFGVDLHTILAHPLNRRWKERYPRNPNPGDIVVIPRLAPTTTIVSSGQPGSGGDYGYYTSQNQTLREIARTISDVFRSSAGQDCGMGESGKNITAELILYWNRDHLPKGVGVADPLPAGIALFIVSDFRRDDPPKMVSVHSINLGAKE